MAIGLHVYGSQNITEQKKTEKIMQCTFIKSLSFLYGSGFFLKRIDYYAFIAENWKKNQFFEWNFIQKLKIYKWS